MSQPFLGELKLVPYNFAPLGWAFCAGQLMPISQNTALFSLIGTTYGGDGQTTFALPDLRGRAALGQGQGPGLSNYDMGEVAGVPAVTLTLATMPTHSHTMHVSSVLSNQTTPSGQFVGTAPLGLGNVFGTGVGGTMPGNTIGVTGGSQPHENHQPYLGLNYVIALEGVFPSRN